MQPTMIIAVMAIGAVTLGTLGFANTLTVSAINPIGGNDGLVATPTATISAVTWTEIATSDGDIEIDAALVTVVNSDAGNAHTYEVCVVLSDGVSVASVLGCQSTASIAALGNEVLTVDFGTDFDTIVATNIYITAEETV